METDRTHALTSGFLALLVSQISTRIITFALNLLIARHLTPEAYGLSTVQFHLLTTTALFISREGFRRGCLRLGGGGGGGSGSEHKAEDAAQDKASEHKDGETTTTTTNAKTKSECASGFVSGYEVGDGGADDVDSRSVLRVAWLVAPLGLLVTAGVCGGALWRPTSTAAGGGGGGGDDGGGVRQPEVPYYREAVLLHGLAALLELLAEPFYILASAHLMFGPRVAVEFASTLAKSTVTLALLAHPPGGGPLPPALVFSMAQLALAVVVLVGYVVVGMRILAARDKTVRNTRRAKGTEGKGTGGSGSEGGGAPPPRPLLSKWWTPRERQVLGASALFTLQAVEKLALAEGSKMVLASMQSAVNQGVYGLVSNLGSLVVRTLFQPLEEVAFAAFSAWGAAARAAAGAGGAEGQGGGKEGLDSGAASRPQPHSDSQQQPHPQRQTSPHRLAPLAAALGPMVKAVSLLGLTAAAFGPSFSYTLLRAVYGTRWSESEAPVVLAAYSVYVLLLALNGISEAFVHAVLDARGLQQSNALLLVFSGAHLAVCVALVRQYGALGLVAADGANIVLRIGYSAWCIRRFFQPLRSFSLCRDLLPAPATLAAFLAVAAAAAASKHLLLVGPGTDETTPTRVFLRRAGAHVGVGVGLLAVLAGVLVRTERGTLRQVVAMRRRRRAGRDAGQDEQGEAEGVTRRLKEE